MAYNITVFCDFCGKEGFIIRRNPTLSISAVKELGIKSGWSMDGSRWACPDCVTAKAAMPTETASVYEIENAIRNFQPKKTEFSPEEEAIIRTWVSELHITMSEFQRGYADMKGKIKVYNIKYLDKVLRTNMTK